MNFQIIWKLMAAVLIAAIVSSGCAKRFALEGMRPEQAYRYLEKKYNNGDYIEAIDGLEFFTLNYSGSALVDSAWFLLAESHFSMKEYLLAEDAFDELTRRYPRSGLVPEAMFNIGACYWKLSPKYSLDQEYTNRAIDAFQAFIDFFPDYTDRVREAQDLIEQCRDKLAHKIYASSVIYIKMKDYPAAVNYLQWVIDEYYDTDWSPRAAYQIGVALQKGKKYPEAIEAYRAYLQKYPKHEWISKAENGIREVTYAMTAREEEDEEDRFGE